MPGGRDPDDEGLVRVLPGWSRPSASFYFVYPATRHVPKKLVAFRDFVLETFGLPVHAVGVGEKAGDLRPFDAGEFARGLVGA